MGLIALIIFIVITIVMSVVFKRNIAEAILFAVVGASLVGGANAPELFIGGIAIAGLGGSFFWYGLRVHEHDHLPKRIS
ncbi:putative membrane protein YccC [Arthrobacter sp. CAN_A214]